LYVWRSSEPAENVDAFKYPDVFLFKPEDLADLPVAPNIPPLPSPSDSE
jgi:hypothetical protein